ncbi:hypothetical protein T07_12130 [Trichinella nelsoni]|uniref:Uncharacterized protein n=1 Tax=Trichinella nelsoni TaxID=6336 RepID=A0A0V0RZ32_9BILA|nr:hypothetical protein T07_12130 [Trichinella nelsoni]
MQIGIVKVCGRSILISREEYESVPGGYCSLLLTSESKTKNTGSLLSKQSRKNEDNFTQQLLENDKYRL